MIVAVQWTLSSPQDWVNIDLSASGNAARRWLNLAKKPVPTGSETINSTPGWIFDICIQGVHLYGFDHVAGEPIAGGGLRFYGWNDDLADDETDYRWGEVWEFHNPRPDPKFGGQINTHQVKTIFTEPVGLADFPPQETSGGPVQIKTWDQWVMPPDQLTRHGIWVRDENLWQQHFNVRSKRSWREWI